MKKLIIGLSVLLFTSICFLVYQAKSNNEIKADLSHEKKTFDTRLRKELNDQRKVITDSMRLEFESLTPDTIIKTEIQTKYDTVTTYIHSLPANDQFRWSAKELDRLYDSIGFSVHFKSGVID